MCFAVLHASPSESPCSKSQCCQVMLRISYLRLPQLRQAASLSSIPACWMGFFIHHENSPDELSKPPARICHAIFSKVVFAIVPVTKWPDTSNAFPVSPCSNNLIRHAPCFPQVANAASSGRITSAGWACPALMEACQDPLDRMTDQRSCRCFLLS